MVLCEVLRVMLRVGRRSIEKLLDMLTDRDTCFVDEELMELAGEIENEDDSVDVWVMEAVDVEDMVRDADVDDAGLWLPVTDTVEELMMDNDIVRDILTDTLLVAVDESDNVPVVVRDHVAL